MGLLVLALLTGLAAWLVAGGTTQLRDLLTPAAPGGSPAADAPDAADASLALVTVDAHGQGASATRLSVLATDAASDMATALLVPTATIADIPGHGTFTLAEAQGLGGPDLTRLSLGNLLGVRLGAVASIDHRGWEQVLAAVGPVEVTSDRTLVDDEGSVIVEAGVTTLQGPALARFLTAEVAGESELEALPRVQQVLTGVLDAVAEDPALAARLVALETPDGTPTIRTAEPQLLTELLVALADARDEERFTTLTLPVVPLGTGAEDGYRVDTARAEAIVASRLSGARPDGQVTGERDVQILNGNGVPGVGRAVADRLADGGYRVVLTGNADRFTYETTRIVLHDDAEAQLAVGRDVQQRLGVGELELAATPGSVVDVTVVVGADFRPDG